MSDDTNIITGRFTAMSNPTAAAAIPDDHPIVALVKEGVALAEEEGAKPSQIVYVMLADDCTGTVGYMASETSGAANPRALLSLAVTMITEITTGK